MIELPPMPPQIAARARDERGYPVPWFVAWIDGKPEFRVADGEKLLQAVEFRRCWVCGRKIHDPTFAFVIGPMCAINRTIGEPPQHRECAEFSVRACPFLSIPTAKRREANMPVEGRDPAGFSIRRNPGACAIWLTKKYKLDRPTVGEPGVLFRIGNPQSVHWYCEGRRATRDEVLHSIHTGLPILENMAAQDGPAAIVALREQYRNTLALLPAM